MSNLDNQGHEDHGLEMLLEKTGIDWIEFLNYRAWQSINRQSKTMPMMTLDSFPFIKQSPRDGSKPVHVGLKEFSDFKVCNESEGRIKLETRGLYHLVDEAVIIPKDRSERLELIWGYTYDGYWVIITVFQHITGAGKPRKVILEETDVETMLKTLHMHPASVLRAFSKDIDDYVSHRQKLLEEAKKIQEIIHAEKKVIEILYQPHENQNTADEAESYWMLCLENEPLIFFNDSPVVFTTEKKAKKFAEERFYNSYTPAGHYSLEDFRKIIKEKNNFEVLCIYLDIEGFKDRSEENHCLRRI